MELLKVQLVDDLLHFSDGYSRKATIEEQEWFTNRKTLAAHKDKNGQYKIIRWADLHRHSGYSLLDGAISISKMVEYTEFAGAITDHGNMCGALQFYNAMRAAGKLPIIGEEFYCETIDGIKDSNHLVLLAKNETGYKNLVKLSSLSYQKENFYKKPHINYDLLKQYHEGLICTSACIGGEIPQLILSDSKGKREKIDRCVEFFKNLFGDDFYLEIQRHGIAGEDTVNSFLSVYAKTNNIKLVATTDSHYVKKEDKNAHEVLLCIGTGHKLSDTRRMSFDGTGYHLHTADEMESLFGDIPEALDGTLDVMFKCKDMSFAETGYRLPKYPIPKGFESESEYFKKVCKDGVKERFKERFNTDGIEDSNEIKRREKLKKEYWERFKTELETIKRMGFEGYFLIVWDFLKFARENNIPTGPGRGSGAGSLVLYCLRITDVDPIKYNLLFERFLNPDRITMPDIDSDISEQKRELVIKYVSELYGIDHVSHIITHGTLAARSVTRDVARVFGLSVAETSRLVKYIPAEPKMTLEKALKNEELQSFLISNPLYKQIIDIAKTLEGLPKNKSVHACGIIIAPSVVSDYCPQLLMEDTINKKKTWVTQYNMAECEDIKLLKMDFLGLRTLDVIDNTVELINEDRKESKQIDSSDIPLNDPKVYKFLSTGHTSGVFQFESPGMTNLLKRMFNDVRVREDNAKKGEEYFERLIAAVSLYRPGPMDEINNFIKAMKTGNVHYDHKKLESILGNTYGILVYQEQIMFAVRELAGFTAGQADSIRKAMGKKKTEIMDEYGEYFIHGSEKYDKEHPNSPKNIKGCVKNGIPEETAKLIWDKMVKFAAYAFNKSHATCYAAIGMRTAWLSCYYPVEFMTGMLNSFIGKADKIKQYVNACKARKIEVLQPDINESGLRFSLLKTKQENGRYKKSIRFGLSGIVNVGDVATKAIIKERETHGEYKDMLDFLKRAARIKIDRRVLEPLIATGAFDKFGYTRKTLLSNIEYMYKILESARNENQNQLTMFDFFNEEQYQLTFENISEYTKAEMGIKEMEFLGLMIHHPVIEYKEKLDKWKSAGKLQDIEETLDSLSLDEEKEVRFAGLVMDKELKTSIKNNKTNKYLTFMLDDGVSTVKCIAFKQNALQFDAMIKPNSMVYLLGFAKYDDFGKSVIVNKILAL